MKEGGAEHAGRTCLGKTVSGPISLSVRSRYLGGVLASTRWTLQELAGFALPGNVFQYPYARTKISLPQSARHRRCSDAPRYQ